VNKVDLAPVKAAGVVPIAVGSREIVWRHPQLGERRRTVVVGAQTPVRLAVDMNVNASR